MWWNIDVGIALSCPLCSKLIDLTTSTNCFTSFSADLAASLVFFSAAKNLGCTSVPMGTYGRPLRSTDSCGNREPRIPSMVLVFFVLPTCTIG